MSIGDLFDKDPRRPMEPVVKLTQRAPEVVGQEIREYVVTEEIERYFRDLLDRFIESRHTVSQAVCAWISGFFGAGKSHFLKVLGYVLSDLPVVHEGGTAGARDLFCAMHHLPFAPILKQEFDTRTLFIYMLDRDVETQPSITRAVWNTMNIEAGLSSVPWMAEVERQLQVWGLWDGFRQFVQETAGRPWEEERRLVASARSLLAQGLNRLDPHRFPTLDDARQGIADVERNLEITPSALARRLREEAERLHAQKGRTAVLLDEISLYIGTHTDRLTDLNALAEQVTQYGQGKVWLFVTAQEALEEFVPKVAAEPQKWQWLYDRFAIRVRLTPANIDAVVKERLLKKKSAQEPTVAALKTCYRENAGTLATTAVLQGVTRDAPLYTRLDDEDTFVAAYPLLPYHVRLMQEIFSNLRAREAREEVRRTLAGRERAILLVVRSLLIGAVNQPRLVDEPVGRLVTFDRIYDAIEEELRIVSSAEHAAITGDIARMGIQDELSVAAVAKALFLLQHAGEWLPCTPENIAAVLYPEMGVDGHSLAQSVKACLQALKEARWVVEEEGKFRFLSEIEHSFEQKVQAQPVPPPQKRELAQEVLRDALRSFRRYNHRNLRSFDVVLTLDNQPFTTTGDLKLRVYSPYAVADLATLEVESLAQRDMVYWVAAESSDFEKKLERAIALASVIDEYERKGVVGESQIHLDKARREVETLKTEELPQLLKTSLRSGTLIVRGQRRVLEGRRGEDEVFDQEMKALANDLFTEFDLAAFRLERDEHIGTILTWQGGTLPAIYSDLQLVNAQNQIMTDRPVPARILQELRRRTEQYLDRTGQDIAEFCSKPPYGWDTRLVRLVLATLFRNGSLSVHLDGQDYLDAREPGAHRAFTDARAFNRARFELAEEVSPAQRNRAAELVTEIFGEAGGLTLDEIAENLQEAVMRRWQEAQRLGTRAQDFRLPLRPVLEQLVAALQPIQAAPTRARRILTFLDEARLATLKTGMPLLKRLNDLESQQGFETYQRIRTFAQETARPLLTLDETGKAKPLAERLLQRLEASDLLDRWPDVIADYRSLQGLYASAYKRLHHERAEAVGRAMDALTKHPVRSRVSDEAWTRLSAPLTEMMCIPAPAADESSNFVCAQCRTPLSALRDALAVIEARRRAIEAQLDQYLATRPPEAEHGAVSIESFTCTIDTMTDVEPTVERLRTAARQSVAQGVALEVHVEPKVPKRKARARKGS